MNTTDITERALELQIVRAMTGMTEVLIPPYVASENSQPVASGTGWLLADPRHFDRDYCLDLVQLRGFLLATQPETAEALALETEGPTRAAFLARLEGEIAKRGTIDVLRSGVNHGPHHVDLFYGSPTPGNDAAAERFALNRFAVARQLRYSKDDASNALDLAFFVNGLPVATAELKNTLTGQTYANAITQYELDRSPKEKLFQFGRCIAHFALDDQQVWFCTALRGKQSWFLPFNRGHNDGAGNPPNPDGIATDYLWMQTMTRDGLTEIIENYAQIVETKDEKTGKKRRVQIWPRFHQLDAVRNLLAHAQQHGAGRRYLIQHSAGSGKSNSIAWLAHQLVGLRSEGGGPGDEAFDAVIVVTDRKVLDRQIAATIKQFAQVGSTVGRAENSAELKELIESGRKIIITTVQKFPVIQGAIGTDQRDRSFAVIIDEAHSSQGGKASTALARAISADGSDEERSNEDLINDAMQSRKLPEHASYFAFTATPKNKTLETFGTETPPDGSGRYRAFHSYTMKQAIQEGFILDVLKNYTTVSSYYRLIKNVESDPEFDSKRAQRKLRRYVESHEHAVGLKSQIIVDHFHEQVIGLRKVGGEARAMVVTNGIERAIQYFYAIREYLDQINSPHQAIVAFSGEHEYGGVAVTEASVNGFPSGEIAERIQQHPYRLLVCADKFQTGYDEPLLHTMYVDKTLSGIKAVQTLSRLNRARKGKLDTFVLDFMNDAETIQLAFEDFYRTTILSEGTDPNKLHDLKALLDAAQVYAQDDIDRLAELFLAGADRDRLDPILDACTERYARELDEDQQVEFKGGAKTFTRTYSFLASILPFSDAGWEKLSIMLDLLIPKLPSPVEEDFSKGILDAIDMESYRAEKQQAHAIQLEDAEREIDPVPMSGGGRRPEPEIDRLSSILSQFNDRFGGIEWEDGDRIRRLITEDIPARVAEDAAYRNAQVNSDEQNARIEHDKALGRVMNGVLNDDAQLFKAFVDDPDFKRWMTRMVFDLTYKQADQKP